MTTTTPILPAPDPMGAGVLGDHLGDHATAPVDLELVPRLDAFAVLDHHSRARALAPRIAPPGHYLALHDGVQEWLLPIPERISHLGRRSGSDIRFDDIHVSRRHAILVRYGHHVRLLDDRSSEGTFVNGSRVIAVELQSDDMIRLGPLVLRYLRVR